MRTNKRRSRTSGIKYDQYKPRMDLLDPFALMQLAWVLTYGAGKYSAHNWRGGINYSRITAAIQRHLCAFNGGETCDPESGLPHAAHIMCNAMFLTWMGRNRPDLDDRWKDKKCIHAAKKPKR